MYAEESLMERSLKKPLKFKKKIQMVKSQERKWSLFVEIQRKALGKVRKLKELTMIGACKCQFLFEKWPLSRNLKDWRKFLLQKHFEEKFKPRSPINSRKIQGWKKSTRYDFVKNSRLIGLANFKLLSVKPLKIQLKKELSASTK